MHRTDPPTLKTFSHWPSWLNAYGNLDRSACFELRVSQVRRLAGCIPLMKGQFGQRYRAQSRAGYNVPDLPNERRAIGHKRLISKGHYDITAEELDDLARQQFPRRLAGDWRTGRAPAMRRAEQQAGMSWQPPCNGQDTCGPPQRTTALGMTLKQGGHGPGERAYERKLADHPATEPLPAPASMPPGLPADAPDAGLAGNPNRGATREKRFGLDSNWTQRLGLEKHHHASVSGKQYFLVCPCGRTAYKLFWVLGRPGEHSDAWLADQWIASLDSRGLSQRSAQVSVLTDRYGPIMGGDRMLRCRHCLNMRYGKSPEATRKNNQRRKRRRRAGAAQ
ncbi:MAG: hypothetical protein AAGB26_07610 [Planctomycetota bacterium]